MATDNSPTRNKLIFVLAAVTVVILGALKFAFDDYFAFMMEGEAKAKLATPTELEALHAEEAKKLASGPLPIDQAMKQLGTQGREASPLITPQPSNDDGPLVGWSKGERAIRAAEEAKNAPPPEPMPMKTADMADAGATPTAAVADGGKATPEKSDAGAPHAH